MTIFAVAATSPSASGSSSATSHQMLGRKDRPKTSSRRPRSNSSAQTVAAMTGPNKKNSGAKLGMACRNAGNNGSQLMPKVIPIKRKLLRATDIIALQRRLLFRDGISAVHQEQSLEISLPPRSALQTRRGFSKL